MIDFDSEDEQISVQMNYKERFKILTDVQMYQIFIFQDISSIVISHSWQVHLTYSIAALFTDYNSHLQNLHLSVHIFNS